MDGSFFFALPDEKIAYLPIAKNANSAVSKTMSEGESADGIKVLPRFDLDKLPEDYYSFSYVRMITLIPDRLMDIHFAPQYLYLFDRKDTSRVKQILKLEDIAETYPAIQRKYGFRELEIINKTERKNWETFLFLKNRKGSIQEVSQRL